MPRHKQVTKCLRSDGPVSSHCTCPHCTLSVCDVCGAYEGALTTDCPGERVEFNRQKEVYETNLDYTDDRGWHQGASMKQRSPRFEKALASHAPLFNALHATLEHDGITMIVGCTCGWQTPPGTTDSDTAFSKHAAGGMIFNMPAERHRLVMPSTDWSAIDRTAALKDDLTKKAIAYVLAKRIYDDNEAVLRRVEKEVDEYMLPRRGQDPNARAQELLQELEWAKAGERLADRRLSKCADERERAGEKLVDELEKH
jgi:hypothetical protein